MGTGELFSYFQCARCGCVQIVEVPENLGDYYPSDYFSFKVPRRLLRPGLRGVFDRSRVRYLLSGHGFFGMLADRLAKPLDYMPWIKEARADLGSPILDVGSGYGKLLLRMRVGGFNDLTGIDPFVARDIEYSDKVRVLRCQIEDFAETAGRHFQLIILNHSFEHMAKPHAVLQAVERLLAPGGVIVLRIPVADSWAWEEYRESWWQADAPRHLFLHTRASIGFLAEAAGLRLDHVAYDSTISQFIASESYRRRMSKQPGADRLGELTKAEIARLQQRTDELNRSERGEMAAFYLRRSGRVVVEE